MNKDSGMTVHFIGSRGNFKEEAMYYEKIVEYLRHRGLNIVSDWTQGFDLPLDTDANWLKVDTAEAEAISRADLVVVEATRKSFFVGYRMAQAVQQKKPTIVLYRNDSFPGANDLSKSAEFIYAAEYNDDTTLYKALDRFVDENTISVKDMRFNFFIDRSIYNYLRWAALKSGKTKAEILRNLIKSEIDKKDY